jgi:aminopeptidase N
MKWDEDTFGLEYDLDTYNIVAVNDFNMGAMENKGLNVFNTAYTLADLATATDTDFERIEAVIGMCCPPGGNTIFFINFSILAFSHLALSL